MDTRYSRRHFLSQAALAASTLPFIAETVATPRISTGESDLPDIHIFSKHLQFLNYADMADAAATMGFDGVDLTVRPGGHVLPERVTDDLPRAVEALKKAGLSPKLMTTAVGNAADPVDSRLLKMASQLGFQQYRMTWYEYNPQHAIPADILDFQQKVQALGALNKSLNLIGCYQNHAGLLAGSSVWEIWEMLKTADPAHIGTQYDIRHAMVEGMQSWPNGLQLLLPSIKSITVKDFQWAQKKNGETTTAIVEDVPMGAGIVDFKNYFNILKKSGLQVPITLHIEYPIGGAEHGNAKLTIPQRDVFAAMKRDLNQLKERWRTA